MPGVLLQTGLGHILAAPLLLLHIARIGHRLGRVHPDATHSVIRWQVAWRDSGPGLLRRQVRARGLFGRVYCIGAVHVVISPAGGLGSVETGLGVIRQTCTRAPRSAKG